jgi:hypothetical protein
MTPVLRGFVLLLGIAALAGAALVWMSCGPIGPVLPLAIAGLLVVVGVLAERVYYKRPVQGRPPPPWQATGERFVDPETGRRVQVFHNPDSGQRQYVEE